MKKLNELNDKVAVMVTNGVATMWCAYIFAALAIWGGTSVDWSNTYQIVQWFSQTFLQLVLLSIIMVGQKVVSGSSDAQAKEMHDAVMQELEIAKADRTEMIEMHKEIKELLLAKGS